MGFHHVALATPDLARTHSFYTEAMGFELVKVATGASPEGGWAKHVFYDIGDGDMIAFWELHGDYPAVDGGMSRGVGLPDWVNHLAFRAVDGEHLEVAKKRWLGLGIDVLELDHGFCRSIYTNDVNGTLVEWCMDTKGLDDDDRREAAKVLLQAEPELEPGPTGDFHEADKSLRPAWLD
jgi:catechol 2,3-dioxygenase-like lactoylglutathione lyase family enzyme